MFKIHDNALKRVLFTCCLGD